MLKKLILTAAAGTVLIASSAFAQGWDHDRGWHRGWEQQRWEHRHHWHPNGYVVVRPAPVIVSPYYAPAPVYMAPPAPVYSVPAPAYYPAPVYAEPSVSVRLRFPL
jgi:hypothetical protein